MAKWSGFTLDDVDPLHVHPAGHRVDGSITARLVTPSDYSLWMVHARLGPGTTITWTGQRSEEAVYIIEGEVAVDGRRCEKGGAVIIERASRGSLVAIGDCTVVHFGSTSPDAPTDGPLGPPAPGGTALHVLGPDGAFLSGDRENVHAVWFADGTCESCRVQLLEVSSPPSTNPQGKPHSHSEDEIIYLVEGAVRMGSYSFGPGSALCIPRDVRYSLVGDPGGYRFVNFRRDVSWQIYDRNSEPLLETALARGGRVTGDVR